MVDGLEQKRKDCEEVLNECHSVKMRTAEEKGNIETRNHEQKLEHVQEQTRVQITLLKSAVDAAETNQIAHENDSHTRRCDLLKQTYQLAKDKMNEVYFPQSPDLAPVDNITKDKSTEILQLLSAFEKDLFNFLNGLDGNRKDYLQSIRVKTEEVRKIIIRIDVKICNYTEPHPNDIPSESENARTVNNQTESITSLCRSLFETLKEIEKLFDKLYPPRHETKPIPVDHALPSSSNGFPQLQIVELA